MKYAILSIPLLAILALDSFAADGNAAKYPLLEQLSLPEETLPAGCKIVEFPADVPIKGLKNRTISNDPLTFLMGDSRFKELIDPQEVEAKYLGIYKEKRDLFVFGWAFKSEEAASATHKKLVESYANRTEHMRFWLAKKELVMLGRDSGTTVGSFQHFEKFIQDKVAQIGEQLP
jgi:hypothetical protein